MILWEAAVNLLNQQILWLTSNLKLPINQLNNQRVDLTTLIHLLKLSKALLNTTCNPNSMLNHSSTLNHSSMLNNNSTNLDHSCQIQYFNRIQQPITASSQVRLRISSHKDSHRLSPNKLSKPSNLSSKLHNNNHHNSSNNSNRMTSSLASSNQPSNQRLTASISFD
jgi:hypothetical protein